MPNKMKMPSNEWIQAQAERLLAGTDRDEDTVGALAWNLVVAFTRWAKEEE